MRRKFVTEYISRKTFASTLFATDCVGSQNRWQKHFAIDYGYFATEFFGGKTGFFL
jgi:hypothetical protein